MKVLTKVRKFFGSFEYGIYDGKSVWTKSMNTKNIINYLKSMNAQGKNIFIRPKKEAKFMLCDDLTKTHIKKHHMKDGFYKPGRMVVMTSPDNYQVWIHSNNLMTNETKSYWLKKMCSDPGAAPSARWGRCPCFTNCKLKYKQQDGLYPYVDLIWVDYRSRVNVPPIEGLFSILPPKTDVHVPTLLGGGCVPLKIETRSYDIKAGTNRAFFDCGDESITDFRYVLSLLRRGKSDYDIRNLLLSERQDWSNHSGTRLDKYLTRTINRARTICNNSSL